MSLMDQQSIIIQNDKIAEKVAVKMSRIDGKMPSDPCRPDQMLQSYSKGLHYPPIQNQKQ